MTILIVDTSYVVFYVFYANLKFYKQYFNADPVIEEIMDSPLFSSKFRRMFQRKILEMSSQHAIPMENVVFAIDCDRESIWRRDYYPEYKASRQAKTEFNPKAFDLTFDTIIPWMEAEHGVKSLKVARAEADDIAGVLHAFVREHGDSKIVIVTNDNDYVQLSDDHTVLTNLAGDDICSRKTPDLSPADFLLCKVLCGDKSDNLPGAVPRCGMKTAEKLIRNEAKMKKALTDKEALQRFELNRRLMDLSRVPVEIKCEIVDSFKQLRVSPTMEAVVSSATPARPSSATCT